MRQFYAVLIASFALACTVPAFAGNTGGLSGRVTDAQTGAPIAGALVEAVAPTQTARTVTDHDGNYDFASLSPDQYALTTTKDGYRASVVTEIYVFADQVATQLVRLSAAGTTAQASTAVHGPGLVQPGVTSNIYSIPASSVDRLQALSGSGNIDHAYSAMQTIPGIFVPPGQVGWYNILSIRGGDQDQVGYEFDGVPVVRRFDNAPVTMLSNLGQQELQVYTGGIPATSEATSISGYINQVVKQGSKTPFFNLTFGDGGPAFYHKAQAELGGTMGKLSYYLGLAGINQSFNYLDNNNGGTSSGYFFPLAIPNANGLGIFDGSGTASFASGSSFGVAALYERENVLNLHYALDHAGSAPPDDIQFLWTDSMEQSNFYSSVDDLGGECVVNACNPYGYIDAQIYTGPVWKAPQASGFGYYNFPSSPPHVGGSYPLFSDQVRDGTFNDAAITKLQYQHNFSSSAFVRIFGYSIYSDWFLNGPVSNNLNYGYELAEWTPVTHTAGISMLASAPLGSHNQVNFSASSEGTHAIWTSSSGTFPYQATPPQITSYVDPTTDDCYNYTTGAQASCFSPVTQGTWTTPIPGTAPAGSLPAGANPQWLVTDNGFNEAVADNHARFTSGAFSDQWRPNPHLVLELGVRAENFTYDFGSTDPSDPARQFWFTAYNNENCWAPGLTSVIARAPGAACPKATDINGNLVQTAPTTLSNVSGGTDSSTVVQPRFSFTDQLGDNDVIRGSYGLYARPPYSNWMQYNTKQEDLASFLGQSFYEYGFTTPEHDLKPDTSLNLDVSWEHRFAGTALEFKLTPFVRTTQNQEQIFDINTLTALESGLNVGRQTTAGVELMLADRRPTDEGWSWQLAYTHLHSQIRYSDFSSGFNVIDMINSYIRNYNAYTGACASPAGNALCGQTSSGAVAAPYYTASGAADSTYHAGDIANPYYGASAMPLLARNGSYPTYDIFPGPFIGANSFETPDFGSFVATYHHKQFSITPSIVFNSGASYGSPLVWPGYDPLSCQPIAGTQGTANTQTCSNYLFAPDYYTGKFDTLGVFKQPWRLTGNLQMSYQTSRTSTLRLTVTNLFDICHQRGYAWDDPGVCVYSQLPASVPPVGNFVPLSSAPPELRYPYAMWNDNLNLAYLGSRLPMQLMVEYQFAP